MAMNSAILLAEENRQLRAINAKQTKKRARRRTYIATSRTLTIQEGLALSEPTVELVIEAVGGVATDELVVRTRAPRTCSMLELQLRSRDHEFGNPMIRRSLIRRPNNSTDFR
jgi:hypothetical protein